MIQIQEYLTKAANLFITVENGKRGYLATRTLDINYPHLADDERHFIVTLASNVTADKLPPLVNKYLSSK